MSACETATSDAKQAKQLADEATGNAKTATDNANKAKAATVAATTKAAKAAEDANASKEACDETAAKLAALFPLGIYLDAEGFICQKAKE